jgi:hypothetical protein
MLALSNRDASPPMRIAIVTSQWAGAGWGIQTILGCGDHD